MFTWSTCRGVIVALALMLGVLLPERGYSQVRPVVILEVEGPIGPATSDYLHRGFEQARETNAGLVVLRMNTPGGLDTSMRAIIQDILSSPIPVVTYVSPGGARAASAGTYILYASHVAAMAPATNLGAATPIAIGGGGLFPGDQPSPATPPAEDQDSPETEDSTPRPRPHPTMSDKAVSDAVAYIRSLAQLRGRNADWAVKAVNEAASLSAEDALGEGVIDFLEPSLDALLARLDGHSVMVLDQEWIIRTVGAERIVIATDWRVDLLAIITNPNVAYILLLIGVYGLIIEFYTPGMFGPGIIGVISLLLSFYALHILPVNYAGLALILLGIGLMVAEATMPSFGVMGLGGVAAFILGSVLLLDTDIPGFGISWVAIGSVAGVTSGLFFAVLLLAVRARHRPVVSGTEEMVGDIGKVAEWEVDHGRIRIHGGELWRARNPHPLQVGAQVRVTAVKNLMLDVEPAEGEGEAILNAEGESHVD